MILRTKPIKRLIVCLQGKPRCGGMQKCAKHAAFATFHVDLAALSVDPVNANLFLRMPGNDKVQSIAHGPAESVC